MSDSNEDHRQVSLAAPDPIAVLRHISDLREASGSSVDLGTQLDFTVRSACVARWSTSDRLAEILMVIALTWKVPIVDGEAIVQLINLYALAVDAKQWRLFDQIFTDDVQADYGGASWSNLADWRKDFTSIHEPYDATQHIMSNTSWTVVGDCGNAFTYGLFRLIRRGVPGGDMMAGGVWYDDTLRKTPDGWRISKRIARTIWVEGNLRVAPGSGSINLSVLSMSAQDGSLNFVDALVRRHSVE